MKIYTPQTHTYYIDSELWHRSQRNLAILGMTMAVIAWSLAGYSDLIQ